ncbi:hypothetical protein HDV06_004087 [Boothiomyces sp. JEL0866]|nr:hypothetical protein HDV06_004087 [Boothiomyces sp. JEL0866]
MQPTYWRLALISTICIMTGFGLSLFAFVTTNDPSDCMINRKISYSIRYVGFLMFDLSQARKFIRIYADNSNYKIYAIYAAFLVRTISYVYNVVYVSGAVAFTSVGAVNQGPCQTVFQPYQVYQEHIISVFYEGVLIIILALYAKQKSTHDSFIFSDLLRKVMDFEMYCFAFYLLIEIIYLIVYAASPKNLVSVFNIFYLQIPVILFFATTINILIRKHDSSYTTSRNQSGDLWRSKSRTGLSNAVQVRDLPTIFAPIENNSDISAIFGKQDSARQVGQTRTIVGREPAANTITPQDENRKISQKSVLVFLLLVRRKIQPVFWRISFLSTLCILLGFSLSLLGFVTTNEPSDCAINRKISYSVRYIGFLIFDFSQARKFIRVYSNNSKRKINLIYGALFFRFCSYVYNAIFVSGAVAFNSENATGIGPCQTVFAQYMVYQEHFVSVLFEGVLILILVLYASLKSANDSFVFSDLLKKIMDFEMYSFAFYLLVEIVYLFVYSFSPKNLVSVFNIFYLQIPVILFFATTINVLERKHESNKELSSTNVKSKGMSTAKLQTKETPSIFVNKDPVDVATTFGKTETKSVKDSSKRTSNEK